MKPKRVAEYKTMLMERLAHLVEVKRKAAASIKHVQAEIRDLDSGENVGSGMELTANEAYFTKQMPIEKLCGMSQPEAAVAVARHYGGLVRVSDLIRILQEAELLKSKKNAANIVYRVIVNSGRFVRVSTGLYRLKSSIPIDKVPDGVSIVPKSQVQ
jgi:hypothetical protein